MKAVSSLISVVFYSFLSGFAVAALTSLLRLMVVISLLHFEACFRQLDVFLLPFLKSSSLGRSKSTQTNKTMKTIMVISMVWNLSYSAVSEGRKIFCLILRVYKGTCFRKLLGHLIDL